MCNTHSYCFHHILENHSNSNLGHDESLVFSPRSLYWTLKKATLWVVSVSIVQEMLTESLDFWITLGGDGFTFSFPRLLHPLFFP